MKPPISALLACVIGTLSVCVLADEVKNTCEKPVPPNIQSSDHVIKYFNRRMAAYKTCTDAYAEERRTFAKLSKDPEQAQKANNDAEAAIKEFNELVEEVNQRQASKDE
ncbi:MAG TPA: hypothetical protein VF472_25650 [Burkholderiaceae bacterium]